MKTTWLEGIVFDKDGTLTDYHATWSPLNEAAAHCAAHGDTEVAAHLLQIGGHDSDTGRVRGGSLLAAADTREIAEAWVAAGAAHDVGALECAIDAIFEEGAARAVPVTDIDALFQRLRARGLSLGVATSDSESAARATLRRLCVRPEELFVAGYDSGHGRKPSPGMVQAFCEAHDIAPARVAVVGDNLHDIRMGRSAGCGLCIGVLTGAGAADELAAEADHVIDSVAALEALLEAKGVLRAPVTRG